MLGNIIEDPPTGSRQREQAGRGVCRRTRFDGGVEVPHQRKPQGRYWRAEQLHFRPGHHCGPPT